MDIEDDHKRTIIHIDIDCFYAQVEMNKNPELRNKPLGIQQKNIVVTSNYVAREFGIQKCMLIEEATKLCPNLVLVKGEDLHDYRQISYKVTTYLQRYTLLVERLGLDENFVDVTNLVNVRMNQEDTTKSMGEVFGKDSDKCDCGCTERINVASVIANEIRMSLYQEFNLTTCAGIAHNKLLAKVVGSVNKPNKQTLVYPNSALELMLSLQNIGNVPGIGRATTEMLNNNNIHSIEDLQNCQSNWLIQILGIDKAKYLTNLVNGKDTSVVKQSGRPQSIGLEDSCKSISLETEIKEKLHQLLHRLMILVQEDGRIPKTIKLTVRKFDNYSKTSHRESRQVNINPKLFLVGDVIKLTDTSEDKLMTIVMNLFSKIIELQKSFHITLLGLSFTKFIQRANGKNSITNFLKKNVEVQSLTSIQNKGNNSNFMDYTNNPIVELNTDGSESEFEPSPKKTKLSSLIINRQCFNISDVECPSPSKLKVAELQLNPKDPESSEKINYDQHTPSKADNNHNVKCPPNVDSEVFKQLPFDVQQELWDDYKSQLGQSFKQIKKPKTNTLLNYFVKQ